MSKTKQPIKNFDKELDSDESSVPVPKKTQKATKPVAKKDSDDESSDVAMLKTKKARANSGDKQVAKPAKKKAVESDSDESSVKPKKAVKKPVAKKQVDSDDESSEVVPKKKAAVKAPAKKQADSDDESSEVVPAKKAPVKAPAKKQADSSDDESSEVVPAKKAPVKAVAKKQADSSDDEEEVVAVPQKQTYTQPQAQAQAGDSGCTELFLKNLSWNTDDNKIYEHFSKYGTVESTKVLYDRTTGKARGLGFVKFSTRAEADAAMSGNNDVDGRTLTCNYSDNKDAGRNNNQGGFQQGGNQGGYQKVDYDGERHTIFVGNLGFKTTEMSVKNFFKDCGNAVDIRIAKDKETGRSKGFCHVDFDSADAVEKAKSKAGQDLDGREVRVDASVPREGGQRGGFGGGRGGGRGGRGGFGGGFGGRGGSFNPLDRAKKTGGIIAPTGNSVITFDD